MKTRDASDDQTDQHACSHCGDQSATKTSPAEARRSPRKYFCPMCEEVESDTPGSCPKCGMALERNPTFRQATTYTCPMHPQIEQDHPGNCPICGMTLEPKAAGAGTDEEDAELRDMTRRLWIGAALSLPVFLLAMAHILPTAADWVQSDWSRWVQFILSTPVVFWAGWPFFQRGWQSIVNRSPNMFTLIALGVGAAYSYSAIVMLLPQIFPPAVGVHGRIGLYFEAAAIITVLVLLGQVLELRARSRTGSALRALLGLAPSTARVVRDGAGNRCGPRAGAERRPPSHPSRRESSGGRPGARRPNEYRRVDDHGRADAGGKERRRPRRWRHGQSDRQYPGRSRTRRQRNHAFADRRDGGPGATQSRAHSEFGRQGRGLVCAHRNRDRDHHFHSLGRLRARAAFRLRNCQRGRGFDHRLSVRPRSGYTDVSHGRRRPRRTSRRPDQESGSDRADGESANTGRGQNRHVNRGTTRRNRSCA